MGFADNFSATEFARFKIDDTKELVFIINEHKTRGTLHMNVRIFKTTEKFTGFTGDGWMIQVDSGDQVKSLAETFTKFFERIENML